MFDQQRAAEFFVVAWCKEWTLGKYLNCVMECEGGDLGEIVKRATAAYPWLPAPWKLYAKPVRVFVGGAYPKLSAWLFSRQDDVSRLKCASQLPKLRPPERLAAAVSDTDRNEFMASSKEEMAAGVAYRLSRDAFKTNQRSAWNVCK